jgi:hypothetical protein
MPLGFDPPHPGGITDNSPTFQPEKCVKTHLKARGRLKNQGSAPRPTYKIARPKTTPTSGRARYERPNRCQSERNRPATAKQLALTYKIAPTSASDEAVPPVRRVEESQCFRAWEHLWSIKSDASVLAPQTVHFGRFVARGQIVKFSYPSKPFETIFRPTGAFLRFNLLHFLCRGGFDPNFCILHSTFCIPCVRLAVTARRFALLLVHASRILCTWNNQTSFTNCFGCRRR